MITISNLSIQYGGKFLFDDISFVITDNDRIGLVGKNGAGKSTLLKIIIDEMRPETGSIAMDNHTTLGYLPQDMRLNPHLSVYEETAKAFSQLRALEQQADQLIAQLDEHPDHQSDDYLRQVQALSDVQDLMAQWGSGNQRENVERILRGLGFVSSDLDRPLSEFSGGWQMRTELAKILLQQPSYILLDEPTNHLDIESIMWLENYLANYSGGVILISHDRAFLDRVTNRTIEIVSGKIYDYRASYSAFMELREQRIEKQIGDAKRQSKEIEHTQMLIEKFRAKKNKAAFAQTLIRKLEKTERIEIDDQENASIRFRFPDAPRSGKVVVHIDQLAKSYGTKHVLDRVSFDIERGEKVAFVGKNGEGKTTLTRIITGKTDYQSGKCELGYNVSVGYFEQHQAENLAPQKTVFQIIDDAATGDMRQRVRSLLGAFLFSGEDVEKKVAVLSGGERSRLALARMLLEPVNLLILDEPTNHLDMQAKEILKQALFDYNGTLIVVSHDREFLKDLTDKVYEFDRKSVKMHIGDVYNFLKARQLNSLDELNLGLRRQKEIDEKNNTPTPQNSANAPTNSANTQNRWALDKELKSLSAKVTKAEQRVNDLDAQVKNCENTMNAPDFYSTNPNPNAVIQQYADLKRQAAQATEAWEELFMQLEELQTARDQA